MRQSVPGTAELGEHGLREVLTDVIEEVKLSIDKDINGADLLFTLLNAPWLRSLLKVYESLQQYEGTTPTPVLPVASQLSQQVLADLRSVAGPSVDVRELYSLLRDQHFQAFLSAHDMVAQKDFEPVLAPLPDSLPEDEDAMRVVCLVKNKQPLGATIKRNEITGEIFVARVIHGGLADRSGLLHAGDRIIEVNSYPVDGLEPEQVIQLLAQSRGTIMFKVIPINERSVNNKTTLYMRAMADYSPQQDPNIPCVDAGMAFRKGDMLEIVDQTDPLWWQAKKLPSTSDCAGLIPSTNLFRRKQKEFRWCQPNLPHPQTLSTVDEEEDIMAIDGNGVEEGSCLYNSSHTDEEAFETDLREAGFRRSMRLCRQRSHSTSQPATRSSPGSGSLPAPTSLPSPYEEVVRYQRNPQDRHRVIALTGPSGVGVSELRRSLLEINPHVYQGAVPHTTRAPRNYEQSGREYHFINRELFDNMVYNHRFLEYGEYKGQLYGTSVEAVKDVLNSGKICVIDIEPHAIQSVRTHELKGYIIYVKPPSVERMVETRQNAKTTTSFSTNRPLKEEDFREMQEAARKIESHFWQLFDHVIVNDDLQDSCTQLLTVVKKAQDDPQWVPVNWLRPTDDS